MTTELMPRQATRDTHLTFLNRSRRWLFLTLDYGLMIGLACFFMFPIIIMVVASLKPERIVMDDLDMPYAFIPRQATFENYSCPAYIVPTSPCDRPGVFQLMPFGRITLTPSSSSA